MCEYTLHCGLPPEGLTCTQRVPITPCSPGTRFFLLVHYLVLAWLQDVLVRASTQGDTAASVARFISRAHVESPALWNTTPLPPSFRFFFNFFFGLSVDV